LNLTKDNPLLIPEIMAEIFSNIPSSDSGTAARMTEVSREWWHVGHRDVWREGSNQLSGLIHDVDDPDRRKYFASLIKTIHLQPGDTILSSEDTILEKLEFPQLEANYMDVSNLVGLRAKNLDALLVPSLRSLHLQAQGGIWGSDHEKDCATFFETVFDNEWITTLTLDFNDELPDSWHVELLLTHWLDSAEQLQHLELNRLSESLIRRCPANLLLQQLLEYKPDLVSLCFPRGVYILQRHIDTFLTDVGSDWSIPSLKEITPGRDYKGRLLSQDSNAPRFADGQPAAQLLDRMPNLEELAIVFSSVEGSFANGLACVFDSLSKLKHLKKLDLDAEVLEADVYGEWLTQLAILSELEHVQFVVSASRHVSITGAQMVKLLTSLPKLKVLVLSFGDSGPWDVYCSAEEKAIIEDALKKIDKGDLGLNFEVRDPAETEE